MADEFEDYIFENKRETSKDFALANGDVTSVLKGFRIRAAAFVPSKRRFSHFLSSASDKRVHFGIDGLSLAYPQTKSVSFSVAGQIDECIALSGGTKAFFVMQDISSGARSNTSNGVDLTLKAQETPVFSGLFANHDIESSGNPEPVAGDYAGRFVLSADTPASAIPAAGNINVVFENPKGVPGTGAASAIASSRRAVRRNLTLSADDMSNCRSYQVGYDVDVESVDSGSVHSVEYNGKSYNSCLSPDDGECGVSEPATGYRPYRPGVGEIIVIDDPGYSWITERPIGGWGWIPEHPIGGWIINPVPFEEYDIFEEYGIDLSSDWTEYTDSDFSKIDLACGAKLSFSVSATNASTFTIYQCVQDENGGYTLKALQTTALAYDRESGNYVATTHAALLEAGQYCLYVQSDAPAQEGDPAASYKFELNREDSDLFIEADNSDDWTDLETEGEFGEVAYAGTLDEYSYSLLCDWVGFGDAVDYAGFTLDSAAKLSFQIDSTDAAKFTIYKLVRDKNGTYSLKTIQTTSLVYDKEFEEYAATTKSLLLDAGEYYVSMQSANAAQGGSASYDIYLNDEENACVFFTECDNSDDWTDLKTEGSLGQVKDVGVIDENSFDLCTDWVGYGDEFDYAKFTLNSAANLSFSIDSTGAAKFSIYKLVRDKNGTYSLKTLQTTTLSYDKDFEEYMATTKALLLEAGEYYFSVQSANAAKGGSADYDICLNWWEDDACEFFTLGNNVDDWTDLKTEGECGEVGYLGFLDESRFELLNDWVGFGDAVDYAGFTLDTAAKLSFSVMAGDAVKFTIFQLIRDKKGSYSLKALQTTSLSYDSDFETFEATTKSLYLEKGDYYICVQSANAEQGGSAWYNVCLNGDDSVFFTDDNSGDNWSDLETLGPDGSVGDLGVVDEYCGELTSGCVGGKNADYAKISLYNAAKLSFSLGADDAAKFTICRLVRNKNGKYSLNALQTTSLSFNKQTQEYDAVTKALLLEAGDYYISMQSADASTGVSYRIDLNDEGSTFYTQGWNGDDWTDLKTEGACGEVGYAGAIDEYSSELLSDWVGFGDAVDYAGFTLFNAASVRFSLNATDAATFTVYSLVQMKSGMYTLTPLQTTALTLNQSTGAYEAVTKALLLEAGDYYFSVQSPNAAQGGSAYYTVNVNPSDCAFFTQGWNGDDWTDLKTEGGYGEVGYLGVIDEYSSELLSDWVGFGDAVDYMGFTLFSAAKLSFSISSDDTVTFTIYQLIQDGKGAYSLKALQSTTLTSDKLSLDCETLTKGLLLEAGDYYFSVQSVNAPQGGEANYIVRFNGEGSTFYTEGDNYDDWTDVKAAGAYGMVGDIGVVDEYSTELISGWVGFGDEIDYAGFTLFDDAELSFALESTDAATFTVYSLLESQNGTYKLKMLQSTALVYDKLTRKYAVNTKALDLEAGEYYFSVQSANAAQGGSAYYTLSLNESESKFFPIEYDGDNWGAVEYVPNDDPICRVDPVEPEPVWTVICGYPPCDEPVAADPVAVPVDDALAAASFAVDSNSNSGLVASDLSESKRSDGWKDLSSIA